MGHIQIDPKIQFRFSKYNSVFQNTLDKPTNSKHTILDNLKLRVFLQKIKNTYPSFKAAIRSAVYLKILHILNIIIEIEN